jgi:YHS domain-containing protein
MIASVNMKEEVCTICKGRTHEAEDITTKYEGINYLFCSSEHKKEFKRMPEQYIR